MTRRLLWIICGSALFVLSSCGSTIGQASGSGTQSNGPVSIATDHSSYAPDGTIHVTVYNGLSTSIYAQDTQASCSIMGLEIQAQGAWQASAAARCALGRPAAIVEIAAGKSYTTAIQGSPSGPANGTLPSGTYRLLLNYATTPSIASLLSPTIVTSVSFTVH